MELHVRQLIKEKGEWIRITEAAMACNGLFCTMHSECTSTKSDAARAYHHALLQLHARMQRSRVKLTVTPVPFPWSVLAVGASCS